MTYTSAGVASTFHTYATEGLLVQTGDKLSDRMFNSGAGHN